MIHHVTNFIERIRNTSILGRALRSLCVTAFVLKTGTGACACSPRPSSPEGALHTLLVEVEVEPKVNDDSPVALSILVVHDKSLMKELLELNALQWFERREQYLREHNAAVDEVLREFVPGQQVAPFWHRLSGPSTEGVLFVKYRAPGVHRYRFDPLRPVRFILGNSHVKVSAL
jgi:hypothetical protein